MDEYSYTFCLVKIEISLRRFFNMQLRLRLPLFFACFVSISSAALVYEENLGEVSNVYSAIAYANVNDIKTWSNFKSESCSTMTQGFTVNATYSNKLTQAQAYVGVDSTNKLIVLAFRGSENIVNWVQDIWTGVKYKEECHLQGMPVGNVHEGFCDYYVSMTPNIIAGRVNDLALLHPTYQVLVTGHSLGACIASLAAAHIGLSYPQLNPVVYSLGEARVGDISFVKKFDESGSTGFRIVHRHDPVAHLSFCCAGCEPEATCPYHQGTQIFYQSETMGGGKYTTCEKYEDPKCDSMPIPFSVGDHLTYFNVRTASLCKQSKKEDEGGGQEEEWGGGGGGGG